jgi:hypothetical protein
MTAHYKTKKFLCSYRHEDAEWSILMDARDWEDAKKRCKKLGFLRLDGELMAIIPHRVGWAAKISCWIQSLFK